MFDVPVEVGFSVETRRAAFAFERHLAGVQESVSIQTCNALEGLVANVTGPLFCVDAGQMLAEISNALGFEVADRAAVALLKWLSVRVPVLLHLRVRSLLIRVRVLLLDARCDIVIVIRAVAVKETGPYHGGL